MSAPHYVEPLIPDDTHEHAGGLVEYRELANRCIEDALTCLVCAEGWGERNLAEVLRESMRPIIDRKNRVRTYALEVRRQIENDLCWFRAPDGYSLWVRATRLSEDEVEAIWSTYIDRAEALLDEYEAALWPDGKRQRVAR